MDTQTLCYNRKEKYIKNLIADEIFFQPPMSLEFLCNNSKLIKKIIRQL